MALDVVHLSLAELEDRVRTASAVVEQTHCRVIWLLAKGHTTAEVAGVMALSERWVMALARRYDCEGIDSLGDRRRGNRGGKPLLSPDDLEALRERLLTPPDDGGVWTGPKVAAWMAVRLNLAHVHAPRGWEALKKLGWSIQVPRPRNPRAATPAEEAAFKKKLAGIVAQKAKRHPDLPVEVWATDEHRLGLKPVQRRIWAPVGQRPIALGHHRYKWLYVTAFVHPSTGESAWSLSNRISKPFFEKLLADFARTVEAGRKRLIVLVLDGAGWHSPPRLRIPRGIRLVTLPLYTPELQPAEHLWQLVDEPIANRYLKTLDDLDACMGERCRFLAQHPELIKPQTNVHWWSPESGIRGLDGAPDSI